MAGQPIEMLIFWLLLTSPFTHCDTARRTTYVKKVIDMTSKRPQLRSGPSDISLGYRKASSTTVSETSTGDVSCAHVTTTNHDSSYPSPPLSFGLNNNGDCHNENTSLPPANLRVGIFTSEDYESVTFVVNIITVPVILLGVLANHVTMRVYVRMSRSVTTTFFCLVTGMDVAFLLTGLPPSLMHLCFTDDVMQDSFYVTYSIYVNVYFASTLRKVIVCVTMMLSVDRLLVVAFPFRTKRHGHLRRPVLYTALVGVAAFLLDSHILLRDQLPRTLASFNASDPGSCRNDACQSRQSLFYDVYLVSSCLFDYIPLIVLIVSNLFLVVTLARHSHRMKEKLGLGAEDVDKSGDGGSGRGLKVAVVKAIFYNDSQRHVSDVSNISENRNGAKQDQNHSAVEGNSVSGNRQRQDGGQGQTEKEGEGQVDRRVTSPWVADRRWVALVRREKQHSVMVLVYSVLFTLLTLPSALFPLLRKVVPGLYDFGQHRYLVLTLYSVIFLFNSLSCAINLVVCFLTGAAFRRAVAALLLPAPRVSRKAACGVRSG